MSRMRHNLSSTLFAASVSFYVLPGQCQTLSSEESPTVPTRQWAANMFLNGDNDLLEFISDDLQEVRGVTQGDNILGIVAQLDEAKTGTGPGAQPSRTSRHTISAGGSPVSIGHKDSSERPTLTSFLKWANKEANASKRMLIVGSHGSGVRGTNVVHHSTGPASVDTIRGRSVLFDNTSRKEMAVEDFATAIRDAIPGRKLEIVGLDACLMSTIEVGYALRDVASILVASEEIEIKEGWNHSIWPQKIIATHGLRSENQVAGDLIDSYISSLSSSHPSKKPTGTLAALDLTKITKASLAVNKLGQALLQEWPIVQGYVRGARENCESFGDSITANTVDIGCFAETIRANDDMRQKSPGTFAAAKDLIEELCKTSANEPIRHEELGIQQECGSGGLIMHKFIGSKYLPYHFYHGVAIYFPTSRMASKRFPGVTLRSYLALEGSSPKLSFVSSGLHDEWIKFINVYLNNFAELERFPGQL